MQPIIETRWLDVRECIESRWSNSRWSRYSREHNSVAALWHWESYEWNVVQRHWQASGKINETRRHASITAETHRSIARCYTVGRCAIVIRFDSRVRTAHSKYNRKAVRVRCNDPETTAFHSTLGWVARERSRFTISTRIYLHESILIRNKN